MRIENPVIYVPIRYSTIVEDPLQTGPFMQNKANFRNSQINISSFTTSKYEQLDIWWDGKNKPNSKPISKSEDRSLRSEACPESAKGGSNGPIGEDQYKTKDTSLGSGVWGPGSEVWSLESGMAFPTK
jgi:hypothetical protein